MAVVLQKYGGSSVATPGRIQAVAGRVILQRQQGHDVVVVVSAPGDTTDELLAMAGRVSRSPSGRELDVLLATGEQTAIALLAMAIQDRGWDAVSFTGAQGGIITDDAHRRARILRVEPHRIRRELDAGRIAVVAGFQGINGREDITTLGRGGSDLTAVALAVALGADSCEIYTDVDGIFTADPRLVPEARKLDTVSYAEMMELASLGAQVMQLRAVEYAMAHRLPIHVRSSFHQGNGTWIREEASMEKQRVVTGVAVDARTVKFTVRGVPDRPGVAHALFSRLAERQVNVDLIIQSAARGELADMSFTVAEDDAEAARAACREAAEALGAEGVDFDGDVAKVSIVGAGMVSTPGVAARMFGLLAGQGINIELIGCSEIKISCVVRRDRAADAARALHDGFGLAGLGDPLQGRG